MPSYNNIVESLSDKIKEALPKPPKFIQFFCTILFSLAGLTLLFCSLYLPPHGEIHPTVLAAFGMILTFVGTSLGIDYNYRSKLYSVFSDFVVNKSNSSARKTQNRSASNSTSDK